MLIFSQDLSQVPDLPQLEANVHIRHPLSLFPNFT
jgi:hypothetical protein